MDMNEHRTASGWLVITPAGRLDAHTAPEAERILRGKVAEGVKLAVALGGVDYLSSAGLRALLSTLKLCHAQQGRMALLQPRENVQEVLDVSGFTSIFPILAAEVDLD